MKKTAALSFILLILVACKDSMPHFAFSGNYGTGGDTLYVFGLDYRYDRIDTLPTGKNGRFEYRINTDTIIPLTVVLPDGILLPLYAEPNVEAIMSLTDKGYKIDGGVMQAVYDSIDMKLGNIKERSQLNDAIDEFIGNHPLSEVNIHLLQKYFIEIPDAKNALIRQRIEQLGGSLQDNEYIASVKSKVNSKKSNVIHRAFPSYDYTTEDSVRIVRNRYIGKFMLVTFWASWDSASVKHLRALRGLEERLDTAYFKMLNISLDNDTAAWHRCLAGDSVPGDNICDMRAWDNPLVKELTIEKLPYSILVNPYQRTETFNVQSEGLGERLDSLIDKQKESDNKKRKRNVK